MRDAKASSSANTNTVPSKVKVVWEYVSTLGIMALVVFSARSSLADWYEVPSGSMLPTIQLGDRIFVNKLAYDLRVPFTSISLKPLGEPQRGDIVVFEYPVDNKTDYVKRLVGLPGDTIELRNDVLYINGAQAVRREVDQDQLSPGAAQDDQARLYMETVDETTHFVFEYRGQRPETFHLREVTGDDLGSDGKVPQGYYFMMGDNRDNSSDSRRWGFVPRKNLRGRALRVVLSFDPSKPWYDPRRIRFARSLTPLDPLTSL